MQSFYSKSRYYFCKKKLFIDVSAFAVQIRYLFLQKKNKKNSYHRCFPVWQVHLYLTKTRLKSSDIRVLNGQTNCEANTTSRLMNRQTSTSKHSKGQHGQAATANFSSSDNLTKKALISAIP